MRKISAIAIGAACLLMVGCESLSAILKNPEQLETIYSAAVAGEYAVDVKKDGVVLYTERWVCTNDGKLQCKRQPL